MHNVPVSIQRTSFRTLQRAFAGLSITFACAPPHHPPPCSGVGQSALNVRPWSGVDWAVWAFNLLRSSRTRSQEYFAQLDLQKITSCSGGDVEDLPTHSKAPLDLSDLVQESTFATEVGSQESWPQSRRLLAITHELLIVSGSALLRGKLKSSYSGSHLSTWTLLVE